MTGLCVLCLLESGYRVRIYMRPLTPSHLLPDRARESDRKREMDVNIDTVSTDADRNDLEKVEVDFLGLLVVRVVQPLAVLLPKSTPAQQMSSLGQQKSFLAQQRSTLAQGKARSHARSPADQHTLISHASCYPRASVRVLACATNGRDMHC